MSPLEGSPSEYCHPVWEVKIRMVGLPDGEKSLRICIDRIPACDRPTDGPTSMHTRRAVKIYADTHHRLVSRGSRA